MPQRRQETRRFLATVLFTDIVGSTERAAELGDRVWRDLLEKHNAVVRRELKAFQGREMDTAGDGFFAVFESPERAVRCAESIASAVASLGIAVRAGVHIGECEMVGGKVAGMAVVIGARIAALAGAGEVLVSGSVRDLMTGSDLHFAGGDLQKLKGVEEPWPVYRLVPDEVNGEVVASRRTSMVPLYTRRQRRRLVGVVAGVLVVALAVAAGYVLNRPGPTVTVGEDSVGVIGPGDQPRVSAAVPVGKRPTAVAAGMGFVWVTNSGADSVSRIDPKRKVAVPINLAPGSSPSGVAVGAGAVWVANSGDATVSRIDPATSRVVTNIPVRPGPTGIVVAFGSVWVTNALDASITEINPTTTKTRVIPVGAGPTGIAAGAGYLWVTNQGEGTVTRIDPDTHVPDSPIAVGKGPVGISIGEDAAWVANNLDGSLSRIDVEDLGVTSRTLDKGGGAYAVAAHRQDVWVSSQNAGTLMRVTAKTFQLSATVRLNGAPLGLGFVGNDLWFSSAAGGGALHRGGVLRMVGSSIDVFGDDPFVLDPNVAWDAQSWRLGALTSDGLLGFRRAGGVQGAALVPDLATALPAPTDGGLTYTFHLRKGVRYSTGAPVLAGDIRRGIERAVAHPDSAPGYYAAAILGAQACSDAATNALAAGEPRPDCDLREGITANDRTGTITFHLTKPTPEFRYRLAVPNASAVPQDTPLDLAPGTWPPATGPYKVGSYTAKQDGVGGSPDLPGRLELVRNTHFHVWSPAAQPDGYPDRIVLETGYTNGQAVARVTGGRADLLWEGVAASDVDRLGTRYGSQLHASAAQITRYVFLNATKAPFSNRDARRAVAYALDRKALTSDRNLLSGPVTCQILPPGFPAYQPYCPFTLSGGIDGKWNGFDFATAQDLVKKSGTHGAKVVLVVDDGDPAVRTAGKRVVDLLDRLGYRASLRVLPLFSGYFDVIEDPTSDWNAGLQGWDPDFPAASNYIASLAPCDPDLAPTFLFNLSHYCDPEIDKAIAAALAQQVTDPAGASDAWAAIDRLVVDAAAIIPFSNDVRQDLVSRRVGNTLVHPVSGPLLAQMWVQ
jgi:YVTN family beta-propeller protein